MRTQANATDKDLDKGRTAAQSCRTISPWATNVYGAQFDAAPVPVLLCQQVPKLSQSVMEGAQVRGPCSAFHKAYLLQNETNTVIGMFVKQGTGGLALAVAVLPLCTHRLGGCLPRRCGKLSWPAAGAAKALCISFVPIAQGLFATPACFQSWKHSLVHSFFHFSLVFSKDEFQLWIAPARCGRPGSG